MLTRIHQRVQAVRSLILLNNAEASLRGRLARGALWGLIGTAAYQVFSMLALWVAARTMGRETFGQLGLIQNTMMMFQAIAGTAFGFTASKYVAQVKNAAPHRLAGVIGWNLACSVLAGSIAAVGLFMWSEALAARSLKAPTIAGPLQVSALLLLFNTWNACQQGVLNGFESVIQLAATNLSRGILTVCFVYTGTIGWGLTGAVWALTCAAAVACGLSSFFIRHECVKRQIRISMSDVWRERKIFNDFSLPTLGTTAVIGPANWAVSAVLARSESGFSGLGVFTAANQWRMANSFIPAVLVQFTLPVLSDLAGRNDPRLRRTLSACMIAVVIASAIPAALLIPLARVILRNYGEGFVPGAHTFTLLQLSTVVSGIASLVGAALASMNRMWVVFWLNALWAVVLLAVTLSEAATVRSETLGVAYLVAYVAQAVASLAFLKQALRTRAVSSSVDVCPAMTPYRSPEKRSVTWL